MRDFADALDQRLATLAGELAAEGLQETTKPKPAVSRMPTRRFRRPAFFGTLAAGTAAVGAFLALSGTSLAGLPILETPTTDASSVRAAVPNVARLGVDFTKAHEFGTAIGPGYVLVNRTRDTLCVVIPDTAASFGSSCTHPIAKVEREGLDAELVGDRTFDPNASTSFAFVLPEAATDVHLIGGAPTEPLRVENGVAVGSLTQAGTLTWRVDGHVTTKGIPAPFSGTKLACPDGGDIPASASVLRPGKNGAPTTLDPKALAKACR